jgi:hypothetical protein
MGEDRIRNSTSGRRQGTHGSYECTCEDEELGYGRSPTLWTNWRRRGQNPSDVNGQGGFRNEAVGGGRRVDTKRNGGNDPRT